MNKLSCNKGNMTKLAEALESGEYTQNRGALRKDDRFCCLGVACDLAAHEGVGAWGVGKPGYLGTSFVVDGTPSTGNLPEAVVEWLGIEGRWLELNKAARKYAKEGRDPSGLEDLRWGTEMNDTGSSFAEIAAMIREAYL
jgi:hypothetical protein